MRLEIPCKKIYGRYIEGEALATTQRISFWGGVDPREGVITERRHELRGKPFKDKILVFPSGKGSSGWSGIFVASCLFGNCPKAIINIEVDPLVVSAVITANITMVLISESDFHKIKTGDKLIIDPDKCLIAIERD